jgi:hypothetical protein
MPGFLLAAMLTVGQINVGDYAGYGRTIYVQGEPYCEVEDVDWVEPDSSSYPAYDFTDGGDPGPIRALLAGSGGTVVLNISSTGAPGDYAIDLVLMPKQATTGQLVTVSGNVTITFFAAADDGAILEYTIPVFAVFLRPRAEWNWSSPIFGGIPPGTYATAKFIGGGIGSNLSTWTCRGITTTCPLR